MDRMSTPDSSDTGSSEDRVYRDNAVEIRLAPDGALGVRRMRGGHEVLRIGTDGAIIGAPHAEFARISDHLVALAHDCAAESAEDEEALRPLIAGEIDEMSDPDGDHSHVDFSSECHPDAALSLGYCSGVAYANCAICGRPQVSFLVAAERDEASQKRPEHGHEMH